MTTASAGYPFAIVKVVSTLSFVLSMPDYLMAIEKTQTNVAVAALAMGGRKTNRPIKINFRITDSNSHASLPELNRVYKKPIFCTTRGLLN